MIGKHPAKLDDKKRLFVPSKLREELGQTFFVTVGTNGDFQCLTVYTTDGWKRLNEKYEQLPIAMKTGPVNVIFYEAVECKPDKQFRFSLSQFLMDYAGIDRDVVIVGRAGQAEIWDAQTFARFEAEALSPAKLLASLEAIGL